MGAFNRSWVWAAFAVLGIVLGAAYMLWMYQRVFFGPLDNPENENIPDMNGRELAYILPLVFLCFWIGIYPKPFFQFLEKPVNYIVSQVDPEYAAALSELAGAPATAAASDVPRVATVEE